MRIGTVAGLALVVASVTAAVVVGVAPEEVARAEQAGELTLVVTADKPDCPEAAAHL